MYTEEPAAVDSAKHALSGYQVFPRIDLGTAISMMREVKR